jgi:hypothetical protein
MRIAVGACFLLLAVAPALAQLTDEEVANREGTEAFLTDSEIVESRKMSQSEGVTEPYQLTLELGDRKEDALWKDPQGRVGGFIEGWKYEIAAYRMDVYLGTDMVPATVEKRFESNRGSCQVWIETWMDMDQMTQQKIDPPGNKVASFNKRIYLQRAFDNLIANEDRHLRNILLTEDWRVILIDHSRSFRSSKRHQKKLIFTEKHREGPKIMKKLPRQFMEGIEALDEAKMKEIVGEYLTEAEISAVLLRRDLIVEEVNRLIEENGESATLY